ncbi:unnamed protein product, partial [Scytosiphon promiscuus]
GQSGRRRVAAQVRRGVPPSEKRSRSGAAEGAGGRQADSSGADGERRPLSHGGAAPEELHRRKGDLGNKNSGRETTRSNIFARSRGGGA